MPTALLYDEGAVADEAYPAYWAEVWASGVELADAVSAGSWRGASVLELGWGLGLPSVAAAMRGGRVLATDRAPDALAFAATNAERNGTAVGEAGLSSGHGEAVPAAVAGGTASVAGAAGWW